MELLISGGAAACSSIVPQHSCGSLCGTRCVCSPKASHGRCQQQLLSHTLRGHPEKHLLSKSSTSHILRQPELGFQPWGLRGAREGGGRLHSPNSLFGEATGDSLSSATLQNQRPEGAGQGLFTHGG